MTELLAQALEKASALLENLQNELARELLDRLAWEAPWNTALAEAADALNDMPEDAIKDHRAGRTKKEGFDEL